MKKIVMLLILVSLSITAFADVADNHGYEADAPSPWAAAAVDTAIKNQLVPESLQRNYRESITREQFCELAFELLWRNNDEAASFGVIESAFPDTDSIQVNYLHYLGIIDGRADWSRGLGYHIVFEPEAPIHRQEAAKILDKIYDILIPNEERSEAPTVVYTDDAEIEDWARGYVYSITNRGIMNGSGKFEINGVEYNPFGPYEGYTVEQAIVTMQRLEMQMPLNS